jgi:hypothetical protein
MKGISNTLWVVVAAVVVVVVALVVITIFGGGMQQFATIVEGQSYCTAIGTPVCAIRAGLTSNEVPTAPALWTAQSFKVAGELKRCSETCGAWSTACSTDGTFSCGS